MKDSEWKREQLQRVDEARLPGRLDRAARTHVHELIPNHFFSATLPFSVGVAFGGLVWAWWYERSGSLAGPWVAHIFADLGIMAVGYDLLYR